MTSRILVVDDDTSMCEVMAARLSKRNFDIVTASSGVDGISKLTERTFDVVVTDLGVHANLRWGTFLRFRPPCKPLRPAVPANPDSHSIFPSRH